MSIAEERSPEDPRVLSDAQVSKLLRLGRSEQDVDRPVDDLLDRLARPDGARWLSRALGTIENALSCRIEDLLAAGQGSLKQVLRVKERAKAIVHGRTDEDLRLAGMFCYFGAIAAASAFHRTLITSQAGRDVKAVLLDLSHEAPSPWRDLFERATQQALRRR